MGTSETPGPADEGASGTPDRDRERDDRTGRAAAAQRMQHQHQWVDLQIKQAMERGEFDDLPGKGKPIKNLGTQHDPDWWIKQLIEREKISGILPPALQLRKDDAELDERLDRHTAESEVRRLLEEFNARVMKARYTPVDGPPLVTMPRDVDAEVDAWRARRTARRRAAEAARAEAAARPRPTQQRERRRWFRRRAG
jgi:DnaJ-like protein